MQRLLILTAAELTRDPRARRQVTAAVAAGAHVAGLSTRIGGTAVPLAGLETVRIGSAKSDSRRSSSSRLRGDNPILRELRGLYRLGRLVSLTLAFRRAGRALEAADVVHANDLDALPAAWLLTRIFRARLVYDAHELYSDFESSPPRLSSAVMRWLEGALGRRADAVVTVTDEIAEELTRRFRLRRSPIVVLNCPDLDPVEPTLRSTDDPLRVIYQAAVGHSRDLSELMAAARLVPSVQLTLRVLGADRDQLEAEAAALPRPPHIAEPVAPDGIVAALRDHHIGLVIDRPLGLSNELTLPNKAFEYMMAGLALVVPRVRALVRLVEENGVGLTFDPGDPTDLARALEELAGDRARLDRYRGRARQLALSQFNAEAQRPGLMRAWGMS